MTLKKVEPVTNLDDILKEFSIFGRYHLCALCLLFMAFAVNSINCTQFIFVTADADYSCKNALNSCDVRPANLTDSYDEKCYELVSTNDDLTCSNSTEVAPCDDWNYDDPYGFVSEFKLACQEWKRSLVGTLHSFGYMIGLLLVGPLSDRVGRKKLLIATGVLGGVFGLCRSFVTNYWLYILFEVLEAAIGDIYSPAFMLTIEIVAAKNRAKFYMIAQFGYQAGGLLLTLAAWSFPYFRTFLRVIYAPSLLIILYHFVIDESPRWLLSKGKKNEAVKILENAATTSNIVLEKGVLDNLCVEDEEIKDIGYTALLKSTLKSKVLLKRFLICIVWWVTCTFVSYGITINSVLLQGNKYVNFALVTVIDVPASIAMGYILIYYKRKMPLCVSFFAAAVLFVIHPFLPEDMPWLSISFFMAGKFMSAIFFNITYVFTSELFPTYTRNSMHALCSSLGRLGAVLAPMTPLLLTYWSGLPSILFGCMSLLAAILTLLVPDTADESLPDTVKQAEVVGHRQEWTIHKVAT